MTPSLVNPFVIADADGNSLDGHLRVAHRRHFVAHGGIAGEFARFQARFSDVAALEGPNMVIVSGKRGSGRSTLIEWCRDHLEQVVNHTAHVKFRTVNLSTHPPLSQSWIDPQTIKKTLWFVDSAISAELKKSRLLLLRNYDLVGPIAPRPRDSVEDYVYRLKEKMAKVSERLQTYRRYLFVVLPANRQDDEKEQVACACMKLAEPNMTFMIECQNEPPTTDYTLATTTHLEISELRFEDRVAFIRSRLSRTDLNGHLPVIDSGDIERIARRTEITKSTIGAYNQLCAEAMDLIIKDPALSSGIVSEADFVRVMRDVLQSGLRTAEAVGALNVDHEDEPGYGE
ncbi:hypothetical protein ACIBEJ_10030 [Nonomuraea sp. NPDC050790]|uniref:hypothetical protein n=1 Tax=Nonomuraea sp. NPDC050790 TaxID=3364371 RepID=UPI0037AA2A12